MERQSLYRAMATLALQTHSSIGVAEAQLSRLEVGPLHGAMSVNDALQRLLDGTGLTATLIGGSRFYEIKRVAEPQVRQPKATAISSNEARPTDPSVIVVEGSRLDSVSTGPTLAFDAGALDQMGVASVGEFLAYLPQQPNLAPDALWGDGAQYANLRGLGADLTTVTINGRWLPPSATSGVAFDLDALPLSAVEQVEVRSETDAGTLSNPALGGLIDIRLTRPEPSPTARIEYGAAAGGAAQRQAVVSVGAERPQSRSGLLLEFFERSELPGKARAWWRDEDFRRPEGADHRSRASWPGNISSLGGASLPGLSSSEAAVPLGSADRDVTLSDFEATAGSVRRASLHRYHSILPQMRRVSVLANAEASFQNVTAFAELLGVQRSTAYQSAPPTLMSAPVPATNAFNPFGETVLAYRLIPELGAREVITRSRALRMVGGLRGGLRAWNLEIAALNSEETATRWTNNALEESRLANALASSDRNSALDVFQQGPVGSPALLDSLVAAPMGVELRSRGRELAASARGPVLEAPAGTVTASLGAHWRQERSSSMRTVSIGRAEISAPLWTHRLRVSAGARVDRFSDFDSVSTARYSLSWRPLSAVALRASYRDGFRAPSPLELTAPRHAMNTLVSDPRRDHEVGDIALYRSGSPHLQPIRGTSAAVSMEITPQGLPQLAVNTTFWAIRVNGRIISLPLEAILHNEAAFADRVVRDPPTRRDSRAGRAGTLRSIDVSALKLGGLQASGIDATVLYRFDEAWAARLSATWMDEFASIDAPGTTAQNRIGVATAYGAIPRWRALATLRWRNRMASAAVIARYVPQFENVSVAPGVGRPLHTQTPIDVQASFALEALESIRTLGQDVSVTLGVINLFNSPPAWSAVGSEGGYDASISDLRQRYGYVRVEARF